MNYKLLYFDNLIVWVFAFFKKVKILHKCEYFSVSLLISDVTLNVFGFILAF